MQWINQKLSGVIGRQAESEACQYLQSQGLILISQNYRCRNGEIDIIMQDGQELVFVEVKFRSGTEFGQAVEYFHPRKRVKFELAVQHYLMDKALNPATVAHRIDIIGIESTGSKQNKIDWIKYV